jgi:hypothetical protein
MTRQACQLPPDMPDKLGQMKETFAIEAARNSVYPVGGGLWIPVFHPELRISTPYREWNFTADITRMPEFCAPALGNRANIVTIDADIPDGANGVLYALGGAGGGLTCYVDDGVLCFEYNLFILMRTQVRSEQQLPVGPVRIQIETVYAEAKPGGCFSAPMTASMSAFASAVPSHLTTTIRHHSPSTESSRTSMSATFPDQISAGQEVGRLFRPSRSVSQADSASSVRHRCRLIFLMAPLVCLGCSPYGCCREISGATGLGHRGQASATSPARGHTLSVRRGTCRHPGG